MPCSADIILKEKKRGEGPNCEFAAVEGLLRRIVQWYHSYRPKLAASLIPALANLEVNDFSHGVKERRRLLCCFEKSVCAVSLLREVSLSFECRLCRQDAAHKISK
jgi:hypothetical protein